MNESHVHPEDLYAKVVEAIIRSNPEVTSYGTGKKFGSSGELKIFNKMFALLSKGKLVVKLPSPRVDELITFGKGELLKVPRLFLSILQNFICYFKTLFVISKHYCPLQNFIVPRQICWLTNMF